MSHLQIHDLNNGYNREKHPGLNENKRGKLSNIDKDEISDHFVNISKLRNPRRKTDN